MLFNDGNAEEATPHFEQAAEEEPNNGYILFERGRCSLVLNNAEAAKEDLEKAWDTIGVEPVDLTRTVSLPAIWAEAMLRLEQPGPIIERLDELAAPARGLSKMCEVYALALAMANRLDEAEDFIYAAAAKFERHDGFPHMMAGVLNRKGDWEGAIRALETTVGPSCGTGGCAPRAKHIPSLRDLIALYLANDKDLDRAGELLMHLEGALGVNMTKDDFALFVVCMRSGVITRPLPKPKP